MLENRKLESNSQYVVELHNDSHDIDSFDCGVDSLNRYLREYTRPNSEQGFGMTYVIVEEQSEIVLGYYTLVAGEVARTALSSKARHKLPPHPVPVVRLARLAVNSAKHGRGMGRRLLFDAIARALQVSQSIGAHAMEVDAIDDAAKQFYQQHGFKVLRDDPHHLLLPIALIRGMLE